MFSELKNIFSRPQPYEFYTAESLWNDEHTSKRMLEFHLNENVDPASRNKAFIDRSVAWMVSRFGIGAGTRVADFGCGPGLYTTLFAERGAAVTGIDFSARSIAYARERAEAKGLVIDYLQQNYLEFDSDRKFDLISLIYCDFCPLSPLQRKALLKIFHRHVADEGAVFLDVFSLNAFRQRQEISTCEHLLLNGFWSAEDYYGFLNTFKYEGEKVILDKYTIVEASRSYEIYNWLQYYSLESLSAEFAANGFRIVEYYSDAAGLPFDEDASEIAIVAQKL